MKVNRRSNRWRVSVCVFALPLLSGCGQQAIQDNAIAIDEQKLDPQVQVGSSLSEKVAGWTMFDEDTYLADEFLKFGVSTIKPGLTVNRIRRGDNSYWSSVGHEICQELYTLTDIVKYGSGFLPTISWVQENGNFEIGKPNPNFTFDYSISVLDDETVSATSITDGFNKYVAIYGDTCEFTSDMWFLSNDAEMRCIIDFLPGYDSNCLRQSASQFAPGVWGRFISKLVYSNSGTPSIFSVTTSIPYATEDGGYRRDVMARKLFALPNGRDVFEVAVSMSTSDLMVTDEVWNDVVIGLTDSFFSYVYGALSEL